MTPDRDHTDPGLQPERTTLAWSRTATGLLLLGALVLRSASTFAHPAHVQTAAALVIASAVLSLVSARSRYRKNARTLTGQQQTHYPIALVVIIAATLTVLSALLVWTTTTSTLLA